MTIEPRLDIIGAALADPSRCRILCELMDGRAFTNKELACAANVSPQTASGHLRQLELAGLTQSLKSGRFVYHRIADPNVAETLERLASLSPTSHLVRSDRKTEDTRRARCCYNHLAGRLGVLMTQRLIDLDVLIVRDETVLPGPRYISFLSDIGVEPPLPGSEKPVAKLCLDWTERRHHISGPLAIVILEHAFEENWLKRRVGSRALTISDAGFSALDRWFGINRDMIAGTACSN